MKGIDPAKDDFNEKQVLMVSLNAYNALCSIIDMFGVLNRIVLDRYNGTCPGLLTADQRLSMCLYDMLISIYMLLVQNIEKYVELKKDFISTANLEWLNTIRIQHGIPFTELGVINEQNYGAWLDEMMKVGTQKRDEGETGLQNTPLITCQDLPELEEKNEEPKKGETASTIVGGEIVKPESAEGNTNDEDSESDSSSIEVLSDKEAVGNISEDEDEQGIAVLSKRNPTATTEKESKETEPELKEEIDISILYKEDCTDPLLNQTSLTSSEAIQNVEPQNLEEEKLELITVSQEPETQNLNVPSSEEIKKVEEERENTPANYPLLYQQALEVGLNLNKDETTAEPTTPIQEPEE